MSICKMFFKILFVLIPLFSYSQEESGDWKRVYLATFPRSGNHWMRYLTEEATHIATSTVYSKEHINSFGPFPWGGYCADHGYDGMCRYPTLTDIVLIKTHFPAHPIEKFDLLEAFKTIRVIRHPVDSLYSLAVQTNFGKKIKQIQTGQLVYFINMWKRFQSYWDSQDNVYTLRYEDLLTSSNSSLKAVLKEIGYEINECDINRALAKHPPKGFELKHISFFSNEQLLLIQRELGEIMEEYNYKIFE